MRTPLTVLFLTSLAFAAHAGEVLFSDGFDEAIAVGNQRPSSPPWTRAGSSRDEPGVFSTTLESDSENRFGEGTEAAVAVLSDYSAEKQAYMLGTKVYDAKAVDLTFDFVEPEGPVGGAFYVNLGYMDDATAVRLSFAKGQLLRLKNAYLLNQKVHVRVAANNGAVPVAYDSRTLAPRTYDVWIDGQLTIDGEPFPKEAEAVPPDVPLTTLGFLTFSGQTTAQKVYLKNIKLRDLP
jgi:hypothetical protein